MHLEGKKNSLTLRRLVIIFHWAITETVTENMVKLKTFVSLLSNQITNV